jgi:hypothetical protein
VGVFVLRIASDPIVEFCFDVYQNIVSPHIVTKRAALTAFIRPAAIGAGCKPSPAKDAFFFDFVFAHRVHSCLYIYNKRGIFAIFSGASLKKHDECHYREKYRLAKIAL